MPKPDRSRHNVIAFPVPGRDGVSDGREGVEDDGAGNFRERRPGPLEAISVSLSPVIEQHFGTGLRGLISTSLTLLMLAMLVSRIDAVY